MSLTMVLETIKLWIELALWAIFLLGGCLWAFGFVPARCQEVLDLISFLLDVAIGNWSPGDAAPPARSPRASFSAPRPAPPPPSPLGLRAGPPFRPAETLQPLQPLDSVPLAEAADPRLLAWLARREAQQQQKKTVRFASERVQVKAISPRRSATPPRPASPVACPSVAEPFDPAAWTERLRAFHEAIGMPNCSLLPDPKLEYGAPPPPPPPQQAPVWRAELPQTAPAPAPAPRAPSPPLKPASPPRPAPPAPATTTTCEPEKPQQAPTPPPPPKSSSPPPAVTPAQAPSAAAKPAAPPAAASSSSTSAKPAGEFKFVLPSALQDLSAPTGLNMAQLRWRKRVEAARKFLDDVVKEAKTLSGTYEANLTRAWCQRARSVSAQAELDEIATSLKRLLETAKTDTDGLNEAVFPRGELETMLLKGERFEKMLSGYQTGVSMLRDHGKLIGDMEYVQVITMSW